MTHRVLIVDSDEMFSEAIKTGFRSYGAHVDVVLEGARAMEAAERFEPTLIVLATELSDMSGLLVCKQFKREASLRYTPVALLSADQNAPDIFDQHRRLRSRAELYVRKPVTFDRLMAEVQSVMHFDGRARLEEKDMMNEFGDEDTHVAMRPDQLTGSVKVDDDIDAFADNAFESLVVRDEQQERKEGRLSDEPEVSLHHTSMDVELLDVDEEDGAREKLASELSEAQERAEKASQETERLRKELQALRGASARSAGSVSSREFLDLREALNAKDKELLELRDQLSARDKQLLEVRDGSLKLERRLADFEDQARQLETQASEARAEAQTAAADNDSLRKKMDDYKSRLERSDAKVDKLEQTLEQEGKDNAQRVSLLKSELNESLERLQREKEEGLASLKARYEAQLDTERQEARQAAEQLQADLRNQRETQQSAHQRELAEAQAERDEAIGAVESQKAEETERLRQEHAAQLAQERARAAAERESALANEQQRAQTELAELQTQLEAQHERTARELKAQRETSLAELQSDLDSHYQEQLKVQGDSHSQELAVLGRKLAEAENQLTGAKQLESSLKGELDEAQAHLEASRGEREKLVVELNALRQSVDSLERERNQQREQHQALQVTHQKVQAELERAESKVAADAEIFARTHKAMSIGLALLDAQREDKPVER